MLDLRRWDFQRDGLISLDGEWRFFFGRFLPPSASVAETAQPDLIEVPGSWHDHAGDGEALGSEGAATYQLTVLLPPERGALMLYQRQVDTAMRLFANGALIAASGQPGLSAGETEARVSVETIALPAVESDALQLAYHVANFQNNTAGLWQSIDIGPAPQIIQRREKNLITDYLLFGAFVLAAIYHGGLFVSRRRDLPALLFGVFCLAMALHIPVTGETTIHRFIDGLSYHRYKQLDHLLIYVATPCFTAFASLLFAGRMKRWLIGYSLLTSVPLALCLLILQTRQFVELFEYYKFALVVNILALLVMLVVASLRRQEGALVSLVGLLFLFVTIVNDLLASSLVIHTPYYAPLGLFVFIFSQAYMLSRLFARAYQTAATLSVELKQRNEDLLRLDQLKDEFLANTSHELRTPLNGIVGISDSLLAGVAGAPNTTMARNLKLIGDSGRRLSALVNDLLDLSRLKNRDLALRRKAVELSAVVDVVVELSQSLVGDKPLTLTNETPVCFVDADEDRLLQILHNLIGNAIKFTAEGEVRVSARELSDGEPPMIEVCVEDTGVGIPADKLESIFESFTQADGSIAREFGGAGLGLSITRSLVELHGGRIRAEQRSGGGARLCFTLPMATGAGAESAAEERQNAVGHALIEARYKATPAVSPVVGATAADDAAVDSQTNRTPSSGARILVVDDDPVNLQVLHNHLSMAGYAVIERRSGSEALASLEAGEAYDLVLLDVMMPRLSGYEVCRIIRQSYATTELPVILLTARNRVSDLVAGLESGANDYLVKPFDAHELLARVRTMLELREAARTQTQLAVLQGELTVAHRIQASLLPREAPALPGLKIAARYQAMTGLAGDFYDFCPRGQSRLGCFVADVSGHGVPAALVVSMLKVSLWLFQDEFSRPAELLQQINQALYRNIGSEFVTATFVWLDLEKGVMQIANAAHPHLYIVRRSDRALQSHRPAGSLLGVFPGARFQTEEISVQPGDRVLIYTDGVIEACGKDEELFGEDRLENLIRETALLDTDAFADRLSEAVIQWTGDAADLRDDFTFVVIDVEG